MPKTKKSKISFTCFAGPINSSFVPIVWYLPVCHYRISETENTELSMKYKVHQGRSVQGMS